MEGDTKPGVGKPELAATVRSNDGGVPRRGRRLSARLLMPGPLTVATPLEPSQRAPGPPLPSSPRRCRSTTVDALRPAAPAAADADAAALEDNDDDAARAPWPPASGVAACRTPCCTPGATTTRSERDRAAPSRAAPWPRRRRVLGQSDVCDSLDLAWSAGVEGGGLLLLRATAEERLLLAPVAVLRAVEPRGDDSGDDDGDAAGGRPSALVMRLQARGCSTRASSTSSSCSAASDRSAVARTLASASPSARAMPGSTEPNAALCANWAASGTDCSAELFPTPAGGCPGGGGGTAAVAAPRMGVNMRRRDSVPCC